MNAQRAFERSSNSFLNLSKTVRGEPEQWMGQSVWWISHLLHPGAPCLDDDLTVYYCADIGTVHTTHHTIQQIENTKGMHTRGVHFAPDSKENEEYLYLLNAATSMWDWLKTAPISYEQVGIGFWSRWKVKLQSPNGGCIQVSKYTNHLFLTKGWLQTIDNCEDRHCFACHQLWEDTTHRVLNSTKFMTCWT